MENDQVALLVRHSEEEAEVISAEENSNAKAASNLNDSNPKITTEESTVNDEQKFSAMGSFFRKYWKKIFLASCLLAVLLDPLFLYIPTIKDKDDMKCLLMDTTLKITAVFLRTVTDLFYIMDIIYQIYSSKELRDGIEDIRFSRKPLFQTISQKIREGSYSILVDILAILPIPQVMILIFFSRMRDSESLNIWKEIMNLLVLSQYLPRIIRIYLSFKELQLTGETEETATWIKGLLNFFMYVLASHVLGAVWYFFAIQRMTVCWQSGCGNENGCGTNRSFGCHGHNTFRNITFFNDLCLPNSTTFDFGIYTRAFESGIHASGNHIQKFSNCFWWGLRNLSSLGSNLEPSVDEWENFFAAFISIIGLFLFLYLIGNLQAYMQLDMGRREDRRHKLKVEKRMKEKRGEVERWLAQKGIPKSSNEEIKFCIMEKVRHEVEEDRDVLLDNIFRTLPWEFQNRIKNCMPMSRLKKVPMLARMDKFDLKELSENMKPKKYTKDEIIVQAGKPLEMMLFVVDGFVVTEKGSSNMQQYGAEQSYGEVVVYWILQGYTEGYSSRSNTVLIATECVRAIGDVEAFVLAASDIKSVLSSRSMSHLSGNGEIKEQLDKHLVHARILKTFVMEEYLDHRAEVITTGALSMYTGSIGHAIKRYRDVIASQDRRDNELVVLSVINHENVVKLLGYLEGSEEDSGLVFEYAGLIYYELEFSFEERMVFVAMDISAALAYLHSSTHNKPLIIHRNVNMGHIMVDDRDGNYTAKLVGFGSSKMMPKGQTQTEITEVVEGDDMMGYLDPEFIDSKILTEKVDVYSFGVVLVELLTGQKAYSSEKPEAERNLATFFLSVMENDGFAEVFDGHELEKGQGFEMAKKVADLAKRCLALKGKERPTMEQVHMELKEVTELNMGSREDLTHKLKIKTRIKEKSQEVDQWLFNKFVPQRWNELIKFHIMEKIQHEVEEGREIVGLDHMFDTLPLDHQNCISSCSPLARLQKVPILSETLDSHQLNWIGCYSLSRAKYTEGEIIIQAGKPLQGMLFIVDGVVVTENDSGESQEYGAGGSYGEIVVYWLLQAGFRKNKTVLIASESVRAIGDVEALVLMGSQLMDVLYKSMSKARRNWNDFKEHLDTRLANHRILETFTEEDFLGSAREVLATGANSKICRVSEKPHALKLYITPQKAFERSDNEVAVLTVINHENVVNLLGHLKGFEGVGLVFEYAGYSYYELDLSFEERMVFVAVDISAALAYLHTCTHNKPLIIHRNVNMGHILVHDRDDKYTAKLSGFGSSKMILKGQAETEIAEVVENDDMMGYLDPEFLDSKILSEKVDVYSFGVVLVELLTGRKAYSSERPEAERNLAALFLSVMEKDCFAEIVDPGAMNKEEDFDIAKKVAGLAKRCLALKGKERPTMEQVHMELKEVAELYMGRIGDLTRKLKVKTTIKEKTREVDQWLFKQFIPRWCNEEIKIHIMEKVRQAVEEDREIVGLDQMFDTLPLDHQNCIRSCSPLARLQKVPILSEILDEHQLNCIGYYSLSRLKFTKDEIIIQAGKPLQGMLFIVDGVVVTENDSRKLQEYGAGESYGEIVVYWLLQADIRKNKTVLIASESVRAIGDVEALVLMASDMKDVLYKSMSSFTGDWNTFKERFDTRLAQARILETFTEEDFSFSSREVIATGANSKVYKVNVLVSGLPHALKLHIPQNVSEWWANEVAVLNVINHKNVVKLLGYVEGLEEGPGLVFEYAGSTYNDLDLSFEERMVFVAVDISAALAYLHTCTHNKPLIIHRNVNMGHILVHDRDDKYTAKLSGFGSSKMILKGQAETEIAEVMESDDMMGYSDPEFLDSKILSEKVDVYSFGVVLAELLTGQKAYSSDRPEAERNLAAFFLSVMEEDRFAEIVDHRAMEKEGDFEMAKKVADLAKRCLTSKGKERPTMEQVHIELKEVTELNMGRREDLERKLKIKTRIKEKSREVDQWLRQKFIPKKWKEEIKFPIMEKVRQAVEEDIDAHLEKIFYTLPLDLQNQIRSCSPLARLRKVQMLETMDESDLTAICEKAKPVKYTKDDIIIQAGRPLKMMFWIVDGFAVTEYGSSNLDQGDLYGEIVIHWLLHARSYGEKTGLLASESVRATGDVEALVLMANDMRSVIYTLMLPLRGEQNEFFAQLDNRLPCAKIFKLFSEKGEINYGDMIRINAEGAHALIYQAYLPTGSRVAVKRYDISSQDATDKLDNEVAVLSIINHGNVVKLLGYVEAEVPSSLVFEFIGTCNSIFTTLFNCIHSSNYNQGLSFEERMVMAVDISAALAYLHSSTDMPLVIHQNVSLKNILVDDLRNAKLWGFGYLKLIPKGQTHVQVAEVVQNEGMMGYVDPEFIDSKILSEKVDVYSFGVVLVELLMSQKAYSSDRPEAERNLATLFLSLMEKEDPLPQVLCGQAMYSRHSESARNVADLARRCLASSREERPTMSEVHRTLIERVVLPFRGCFDYGSSVFNLDGL